MIYHSVAFQLNLSPTHRDVWWVDLGWTPGPHQSHFITVLLSWTGERNTRKRLVGGDKDRGISLTNYCHRQNRLDLGKLV